MLKRRIKVIGYQISDIRGISPSYCMHKILIEEGQKPTIERKIRLNQNIQEVVKKEVAKLLDAWHLPNFIQFMGKSDSMCTKEKGNDYSKK